MVIWIVSEPSFIYWYSFIPLQHLQDIDVIVPVDKHLKFRNKK